jgi:exopolysaccharide production protein ExoZ
MSGSSTGRNAGIQWMRALAALLVVVDHGLFTLIDKAGGDPQWGPFAASLGGTGVELFFVISGFVMIVSSTGRFGSGAVAQFIRRRLTRIVPLYWLATAVYAPKLVLVGDAPSVPNLARSLFFVPYLNLQGEMHPVYGLGWTLNHEVFFYAVFAVGLLWSLRATLAITAVTLGALVGFGFGLGEAGSTPFGQALFFWSRPIVLFFLVGMALPFLARRLNTSTAIDFRLAALMSMVLVGGAVAAGSSTSGLPWALALLGSAVLLLAHSRVAADDRRFAPIATALGDASYSIYLTHSFAIGPLGRLYAKFGGSAPLPFIVVSLVVCSALGWLCHRHVEQPLLRWLAPRRIAGAPARAA